MRCSCPECGTYMVHSESLRLGCVCPECGARCTACLGTNTVISREAIQSMKNVEWFSPTFDSQVVEPPEKEEDISRGDW